MEADGSGSGGNGEAATTADLAASEAAGGGGGGGGGGRGSEVEEKNVAEGEPKVKRKMKTAFQIETLEKTYAVETNPSEQLRAELSLKLGLSDRQLQVWHRTGTISCTRTGAVTNWYQSGDALVLLGGECNIPIPHRFQRRF